MFITYKLHTVSIVANAHNSNKFKAILGYAVSRKASLSYVVW